MDEHTVLGVGIMLDGGPFAQAEGVKMLKDATPAPAAYEGGQGLECDVVAEGNDRVGGIFGRYGTGRWDAEARWALRITGRRGTSGASPLQLVPTLLC